jgi:tellurite resistance protein TerC
MHRFVYLKVGLALVLVWVGIKMALHDFVKVPTWFSLGVILVILVTAIVASFKATKNAETPLEGGK